MNNQQLTDMLRERILPEPHTFELKGEGQYLLKNGSRIRINAPADARKEAVRLLGKYWGITADITDDDCTAKLPEEGYRISATTQCLTIDATAISGLRNAFRTLRMLVEPERGVRQLTGTWLLPEVLIDDAPALPFRGLHLCVFPENRFEDIAKKIRFAAYLKFNVVVIEFWGTFPFKSHPELCWSEFLKGSREQWAELIREMREEEGLTLVPQFNVLGHAPNSRGGTAQHVVLNQHPELEPLFEPDGWCWCLTNPNTMKLLDDAVCELHDFFGNPPYFHIGCDEADSIGLCTECRKHPVADLISNHIRHFRDLFASRGARIIMWHDMLLNRSDKRWENFCAMGRDYQHLENMYKTIPQDTIIADWEYGYHFDPTNTNVTYPTTMFFKENGFTTLVCPWRKGDVIRTIAALARRENLLGILETTWHIFYGPEMKYMFYETAQAAWGIVPVRGFGQTTIDRAWRTIVKDMGLHDYNDLGVSDCQVIPTTYGSLG